MTMSDYAKRRNLLMQQMGKDSILILPSAKEVLRNGDAVYPFRQQSDFYYLTGFQEPDAMLVLAPNRQAGEYILFNRPRNLQQETWDGPRAGQEAACHTFLADQSYPIEQLADRLPELLAGREIVYCPLARNPELDSLLHTTLNHLRARLRSGIQIPHQLADVAPLLHEMRLHKGNAEIAAMQKAVDITGAGHVRAMQVCKPGMYEYELEAELMHEFLRQGARATAYNSIVGSGVNSCILHYVINNKKIAEHDLVLIDAGAEYENYAADITRTFPANGVFTAEQRAIYELVLAAQLAAIETIKPGASWDSAQQRVVQVLTQGLIDLGILKGDVDSLIEQQAYFPFYMHRSGHWLGLDVHDAGQYKVKNEWRPLEEGMVLTVEPGLYLSAHIPNLPKRWHNIGVRIEDDVLVTKHGYEVLSQRIPKTIADIETVMAK